MGQQVDGWSARKPICRR